VEARRTFCIRIEGAAIPSDHSIQISCSFIARSVAALRAVLPTSVQARTRRRLQTHTSKWRLDNYRHSNVDVPAHLTSALWFVDVSRWSQILTRASFDLDGRISH
jgi:hypothetical protein